MSNSDWNQRIRQEVESIQPDGSEGPQTGCHASDLKGLLHSIVDQISEADRRHSDTLRQMQEKLGSMGREARSIRSRVPDQFAAAFERIEAGMAELASRVADAGSSHADSHEIQSPADEAPMSMSHRPPAPQQPHDEQPKALRSAVDPNAPAPRRRDEESNRPHAKVDTFDVFESSLPGDTSDPWDREAAEALTEIYDTGDAAYGAKPSMNEATPPHTHSQAHSFASAMPQAAAVAPGIDHAWFESRFADVAARIEQSLADISPDQSFFALSQRLEQFERQFNGAIEQVATRHDVEGVRLIEAHISEIAGHLEDTHNQLVRLDTIESQLADIADRINEVHKIATSNEGPVDGPAPIHGGEIDVHAVAKAAVNEAASRFAEMQPQAQSGAGFEEVRGMIERLMSESRQGEENTTALLDTLQQAMIRLLDRVDAMELAHHRAIEVPVAAEEYAREEARFGPSSNRSHAYAPENTGALDAAVAAVASAKAMPLHHTEAPAGDNDAHAAAPAANTARPAPSLDGEAPRQPERIRQDFIADARRAKMRLSAENAAPEGAPAKPEASEKQPAAKPSAAVAKAASVKEKSERGSIMSPRLMAVAIATLLAGGIYLIIPLGSETQVSTLKPLPAPVAHGGPKVSNGDKNAAASSSGALLPSAGGPSEAPAGAPETAPEPGKADSNTHGEIDPPGDIIIGATTVPLQGLAVDTEKPFNTADFQRASRQHAMARMSGKLGQSAAEGNGLAFPAAVNPAKDADVMAALGGQSAMSKGSMSDAGALDLPPPTVGPLSLRLAAANGDPSAEFEVGARLAEGKGTDQSFKDAAKWYQRSASKGFVQAQYRLGTLYERGLGMKADLPRAEDWYKRAAELGNVKAMHNLAVLSTSQSKGTPDYASAAKWFGQAAERGLSDSQFNLAVLHENGLGVPKDLKSAYMWLSLAARSGDKEAVRRRDILKGKLTGDELAAAENLVATFRNKPADPMANDARTAGEAWKKNPSNGVSG